ncbi:dihydrofolate reductase family protein [Microbacterium sp.]|uniref:dihydrofolate reductase family protein n=1 Tax=Microbacterium sp. TaxID=51671 RepID=UPI002811A0CF|nr:dihydrofolate reductase family protein [Microbacterium sp.]
MGVIIVEQNISADGFAADSEGGIGFFWDVDFGDESDADTEQLRRIEAMDAILFGRRTYEMFRDYWPSRTVDQEPVSGPMNRIPKHVLSSTLEHAPWGDGEVQILRGSAEAAAADLRERYGSIIVWGSLDLTDALFRVGQVDILRLRVLPVVLGRGRSFAPDDIPHVPMQLVLTDIGSTGIVTLEYLVGGRAARE